MDADSGKIIGQPFPIGDRVNANVFDPETSLVASATREGTIHLFREYSPDKLSVVETVKAEFGAKTMALDSMTHHLFVDTSDFEPAQATAKQPNPQPRARPGTFRFAELWTVRFLGGAGGLLIFGPRRSQLTPKH
jgi:hypothetical protein